MSNVYIIDGARTPIGAYLGQYKKIESVDLGINCVKGLLDRNPIIQKKDIEGLVLGQVLTSGLGMNTARQVALGSGMHQSSFAYVINQVCGSGMRAAMDGSSKIFTGESDLLLAGGQESMSRARHAYLTRTGENKLGNNIFIDTLVNDGLTDAFSKEHMGITAENVARKYTVTRQEQDHYSYKSYVKTYRALKNRYFKNELIQSDLKDQVRGDTTLVKLGQLKAVFKNKGSVTAGNASSLNDGAAFIALASESYVKTNKIKPLAKVLAWSSSAGNPDYMGITPITAIEKLMKKMSINIGFFDLIEINEAFAATSIAVQRSLKIDLNKLNIVGGAIALGHPIGCSGTRIITTLAHQLRRTKQKFGVASMCIGGGQGLAMAIERL
ncbi:thiolase family protein [Alphaproteobacteria bacterium]|nr:thiolase family protein [Alphaproteobacteria bacterium]MDB3974532.1 thiolase family protein [Alphaproteobacteria bacterium]